MSLISTARKRRCSEIDCISNLPCNVIDDILKHLPLRDAVRTSILSKRWRYKWITIPYLVFDKDFIEKLHEKYNIESIVYQVFVLHKGPIVKFYFNINDDLCNCRPTVDHWLHFLSNHLIEELTLWFPRSAIYETMPHHLFSFSNLIELVLVNCKLKLPFEFQGFGRLDKISFINVITEPGELRRFISKCPMLEHLGLFDIGGKMFEVIEFDATNLKSLFIWLSDKLPSICIQNILLLEKVQIRILSGITSLETSQGCQNNLIEFFSQLSSIKRLELDPASLTFFARGGVARKFLSKFCYLMVLKLVKIDFGEINGLSCALCLITSFPNLQSLKITSYNTGNGDVKPALEFLKKEQHNCKLSLCHLRED